MNINPNITIAYESNPQKNLKPSPEEETAVKAIEKAIKQAKSLPNEPELKLNPEDFKNVKLMEAGELTEEEEKAHLVKFTKYFNSFIAASDKVHNESALNLVGRIHSAANTFQKIENSVKQQYPEVAEDGLDMKLKNNRLVLTNQNLEPEDKHNIENMLNQDSSLKDTFKSMLTYLRDFSFLVNDTSSIDTDFDNKPPVEQFQNVSFKDFINSTYSYSPQAWDGFERINGLDNLLKNKDAFIGVFYTGIVKYGRSIGAHIDAYA